MLQKFEVSGVHFEIDDSLRKYVNKKIGGLDKYVSKHDRVSAHGSVKLKEAKAKDNTHCTCEVTLQLPHDTINVEESAMNMYAAVDIAEAKLKMQLKKHKDKRENGKGYRHVIGRFRRTQPVVSEEV